MSQTPQHYKSRLGTMLTNKSSYPTFMSRYGGGNQADIGGAPDLSEQAAPDGGQPYKFDPWAKMLESDEQMRRQKEQEEIQKQVQNPWEIP